MTLLSNFILNNRYRILNKMGSGGFGTVYRAWDQQIQRVVAIKENRETAPELHQMFLREARILGNLSHPNLPRVLDYFIIAEQGEYLVMEFIEGENLEQKLEQSRQPFPEEVALEWVRQVMGALHYLHQHNPPVVHRDIKPANIIITPDGRAMLVDFGIAKVYDPGMRTSIPGRAVSPGYSPPEQYGVGQTDARSDIYALGATLYTMLTGIEPPASVDVIAQVTRAAPPVRQVNPRVSLSTAAAIERAMQLNAGARFSNTGEFWNAILQYRSPAGAPPPPVAHPPTQQMGMPAGQKGFIQRAWPWMASLAAVVVLIIILNIAFLALPGIGSKASATDTSIVMPTTAVVEVLPSATSLPASDTPTEPAIAISPPTDTPTPTQTPVPKAGATRVSAKDSMTQVYVPAGEFKMGFNGPGNYIGEKPEHTTYLDGYWFDRTEVTNRMYRMCVEAGGCNPPALDESFTRTSYYPSGGYADYPVVYVTWYNAKDYCEWAGRRLPTEAEWEKAARGPDGQTYVWGEDRPNCALANYWEYERLKTGSSYKIQVVGCNSDTTPVGAYPNGASPYGALDMLGNVREWVADWFNADYYYGSPKENPPGPDGGEFRVIRGAVGYLEPVDVASGGAEAQLSRSAFGGGGAFYNFAFGGSSTSAVRAGVRSGGGKLIGNLRFQLVLRASFRDLLNPMYVDYSLGFRCAQSP